MSKAFVLLSAAVLTAAAAGCVERTLTINSDPADALVAVNDEQIGRSPVTVSFNWYGDYSVRISKEGYETLQTHRKLRRPWHDRFPFDLFAQIWPRRLTDRHVWNFELAEKKTPDRQELIDKALQMKDQVK
jgi:hypothetical protein